MDAPDPSIEARLGTRVRALRAERGLTLDGLAARAAVSRAMLSRIERGTSSPTAHVLGKVCAGLGITVSALFAGAESTNGPIRRADDQPVWRDPVSGYLRRNVAPEGTGSPVDISDVTLPPGAQVSFDPLRLGAADQHVWVLEGRLELTLGDDRHGLEPGDCMYMGFDRPVSFRNPADRPVRYAVVIGRRGAG